MFNRKKKNEQENKKDNHEQAKTSPLTKLMSGMTFFSLGSAMLVFSRRLSGPVQTVPVFAPKTGLYHYIYLHFGIGMHTFLIGIASLLHSPYAIGWSVIILTLIVKTLLMPFSFASTSLSAIRREKMHYVRPQLKLISETIATQPLLKPQREKLELLKQTVMKVNHVPEYRIILGINFIIGITLSFVTVPLYQAIAYAPEFKNAVFFSIALKSRSIPLATLVATMSAIAQIINYTGLTPEDRKYVPKIDYIASPIMLFMSSMFFPAILSLYWLTSQTFLAIRSAISWHILRKQIHKHYLSFKKSQIVTVVDQDVIRTILSNKKD